MKHGDHQHLAKQPKQVCLTAREERLGVRALGQAFSFVSFKLVGDSRKSHSDFQRLRLDTPPIYFSIYNYMY